MYEYEDEILADRLNAQPTIFRGCTSSELTVIAIFSAIVWIPVCLMVATALGNTVSGLTFGAIAIGMTMFIVATLFQKIKRGRPEGYYQQLIEIAMDKYGLKKAPYIRETGYWSIGRDKYYDQLYQSYKKRTEA